ncbi:MAG: nicotinate phosphoribosyltransferase [Bacteroidetes bacterium]|nr:nicotinate phosphoribosyltransferase [Bacteroidota bacterium]MCL5737731.1 nicotinate phosphoribosyltransferase [Bacteroidota bacterium]
MDKPFHIATVKEILEGKVTDIYFTRALSVLNAKNIRKSVKAEFIVKRFPRNYPWAVLSGLDEALALLSTLPVKVKAMPEGTVFYQNEPVMTIEGLYQDFAIHETAILGFLCQASGIATKAARTRVAAGDKPVIHFGARRMHPAITPMIDRNAYVGGCDGVATLAGAEELGIKATGTMPHSMILLFGDTVEAAKAFDEVIDPLVQRTVLIDTFHDEKFESIQVAEALGEKLFAVRLDTPGSRRGDFYSICKEVRWELDIRGFKSVKILVSGGVDEFSVRKLDEVVDAYGVGTSISSAPVLDFAMDIIEIEGKPVSKRGKFSGEKQVYFNRKTGERNIVLASQKAAKGFEPLLKPVLDHGKFARRQPSANEIRAYVLKQIKDYKLEIESETERK